MQQTNLADNIFSCIYYVAGEAINFENQKQILQQKKPVQVN